MTDNHSKAVAVIEHQEIERLHPMVRAAMSSGGLDPATLRDFMILQREWEAGEAKRAYTMALVGLKRDLPAVIAKDKLVDYAAAKGRVTYRHTTLAAALDAVVEPLTRHGFALTWNPSTRETQVTVTCRLTHTAGHYEESTLSAPADTGGGKNPVQSIASTITYLERYSALALLGIATADMPDPDDQREPPPDAVDSARNLGVLSKLQALGKRSEDAEAHVGRRVKDWTSQDISRLREWIKGKPPGTETAPAPRGSGVVT